MHWDTGESKKNQIIERQRRALQIRGRRCIVPGVVLCNVSTQHVLRCARRRKGRAERNKKAALGALALHLCKQRAPDKWGVQRIIPPV